MERYFLPKRLVDEGVSPCFNIGDAVYMIFLGEKGVVRAARIREGVCSALYATEDPEVFLGESITQVDDNSAKIRLQRSEIGDQLLCDLAAGKDPKEALKSYVPEGLGDSFSGSFLYPGSKRTFHVVEIKERAVA
ncbi:hypothetical protein A3K73_03440 [Candidatus Pacearchaeota archaeon RBG_13_36_9]|nr:MAG: hypothetical protein A3K73_03440 [Candidatus Pacearchaeota archaeon RBG_13_36_9]